jgi:C2 domain/SHR-binding domain of vacuolar-sorting associated protein 13
MHCKDGRVLEVSVTITVAPGFLSGYTKIVRFTPRFILVNQLERPLRIWQDSSLLHSVYEDRTNQQLDSTKHKPKEKWKARGSDDGIEKVSNYEVLFTRPTLLDEVDGISVATTAHHSALYITTVLGRSLAPFHLPDTRGDRQFRIDLGGNWTLSPSFNADVTGEHTIRILKAVDLRLLQHVNTRASPHYKVILPPPDDDLEWDGELGVWFETDWGGNKKIIVKGTKRTRYSFNHTDIHAGDELLRIDKLNVSTMTFTETMKLLKERVAYVSLARKATELNVSPQEKEFVTQHKHMPQQLLPNEDTAGMEGEHLVLTFRTLEERLRRLRVNASKARKNNGSSQSKGNMRRNLSMLPSTGLMKNGQNAIAACDNEVVTVDLKVEMRNIQSSMFVVVRKQDEDTPPYRIENRAMNHVTYFRQRGCCGHPWNILKPGETKTYSWEEPMKPKKLSVKIGSNNISLWDDEGINDGNGVDEFHNNSNAEADNKVGRAARFKQVLSAQLVKSEERAGFGAIRTVQLEEIGFQDVLPFPATREAMRSNSVQGPCQFLRCQVDTDGATRVLIISDNKGTDERSVMQKHMTTIERQIRNEEHRRERFIYLKKLTKNDRIYSDEEKTEEISGSKSTSESCKHKSCHSSKVPSVENIHELNSKRCAPEYSIIENEAISLADFPESSTIHGRNQIIVEILEATGLKPNEVTGVCNPYCEIVVKGRSKTKHSLFSQSKIKKRTYYIEKNLAPKWSDQVFIFDLPEDTANVTRGHSVQFRLRNFKFVGSHPHLGQTNVHLSSLRNQQELVGWYPLVGRTGRRELEDTQANWGRGSVKLRVQWIYTVPALLDYYLTLSERRLYDLCQSVAGMNQQLEHLIESEKLMNGLQDPFSVGRIPNLLGIRTPTKHIQQYQQGISRIKSDSSDSTKRPKLTLAAMNGPLRQSRGRLKWLLFFQTAESKRSRRMGDSKMDGAISHYEVPHLSSDRLPSIAEIKKHEDMKAREDLHEDGLMENTDATLGNSMTTLKNASIGELYCSSMLDHLSGSSRSGNRVRSYSLEDMNVDQNTNLEAFNFSTRVRSGTFDGISEEQCSLFENSATYFAAQSADTVKRTKCVNKLFLEGLVYHRSNEYFHKLHLSYRFRASLLETKKGTTLSLFQPKSLHRLSASIKQFRSWIVAQGVLNDANLQLATKHSHFHISLVQKSEPDVGKLDDDIDDSAAFKDTHIAQESCRPFVLKKLNLPSFAPNKMKQQARARAEGVYDFRNKFERACKRSLQAVLNPGGWLTIRPITALNLTDSFTGMHVKLRYGGEVVTNQTVDARVTPCWTFEEALFDDYSNKHRVAPTSITSTSNHHTPPEFQLKDNDLQVYVEPQKTSGSLRLSVVGERLNLKSELGVLHIPLGSAISCCVESMEDSLEAQHSAITPFPMYTRWFPLMSPNDSVSVDGDMGYSFKPEETEQLRDSMFTNYFTPCIKLAFIWQPNQQEVMGQGIPLRGREEFSSVSLGENRCYELESPLTENYFNADFARVSLSLIDSQRALELLSLALCDIDIRFSVTKAKTRIGFVIGWIQVDHQDPMAREPVVLAPTPVEHPQPTLQFLAVKDNLRSKGNVLSYEYIGVSLQELDLTVEEAWMFGVWEFIVSVIRRREGKRKVNGSAAMTEKKRRDRHFLLSTTTKFRPGSRKTLNLECNPQSSLHTILLGENASGELLNDNKVYVEQLLLGFVKVNLSYSKGKRGRWELTECGDFITKSIDGLTQGLPEKMAITAGGLRVVGGRKRQVQSEVLAKWASRTHDEDLWTDSGAGRS